MTTGKSDYSILTILAAIYVAAVFYYQTVPKYLLLATGYFATLYVAWGVFHLLRCGNFHIRIVLEYFLVALLGVMIVATLLV